jgi:hypothetical protein
VFTAEPVARFADAQTDCTYVACLLARRAIRRNTGAVPVQLDQESHTKNLGERRAELKSADYRVVSSLGAKGPDPASTAAPGAGAVPRPRPQQKGHGHRTLASGVSFCPRQHEARAGAGAGLPSGSPAGRPRPRDRARMSRARRDGRAHAPVVVRSGWPPPLVFYLRGTMLAD